ncbi:glycosyltransferase family 4 protein [Deltaproteobacteria bacterium OttesenSCG-928-M10]|nr:glycosyltransferase family 4 protein [Deltaproteobacteria bacterium OttesenSCG-928-M10]
MGDHHRKQPFPLPVLKAVFRLLAFFVPGKARRRKFRNWGESLPRHWLEHGRHRRIKTRVLADKDTFSVLVVLQDLTVTGAPMAGLQALKAIVKNGGRALVAAGHGGRLVPEIEKLGVETIISPNCLAYPPTIKELAEGFDVVLVNTLSLNAWINVLSRLDNVMWYLHEAAGIAIEAENRPEVAEALRRCRHLYVVSEHAASFVAPWRRPRILPLGIEDRAGELAPPMPPDCGKLRLAIVGTIFRTKGQDLAVEALKRLSPELRSRLEFFFLGEPAQPDGYELLRSLPPDLPVTLVPEIADQDKKWDFYNQMDVFCVPSRDESCSLVLLEACMLGKPVLISDRVGGRYMVEEGRNGLIFKSEDIEDLGRALKWFLAHPERWPQMGLESRAMYLAKARSDLFGKNLLSALKEAAGS